jgi:hypothetical protein
MRPGSKAYVQGQGRCGDELGDDSREECRQADGTADQIDHRKVPDVHNVAEGLGRLPGALLLDCRSAVYDNCCGVVVFIDGLPGVRRSGGMGFRIAGLRSVGDGLNSWLSCLFGVFGDEAGPQADEVSGMILEFLAQPSGTVVQRIDQQTPAPRSVHLRRQPRPGDHRLGRTLEQRPQPFVWKATADDIIKKVSRARETLHQINLSTDQ